MFGLNQGGARETQSLDAWYSALPPVSKVILTSAFCMAIATTTGLAMGSTFVLDWGLVWGRFQLWRVVSCFMFLGPFSMPFLFNFIFVTHYFPQLEKEFNGKTAHFLWILMFAGVSFMVINYLLFHNGMGVLCLPLVFFVVYVFCRRHAEQKASVFGLFTVPLGLWPWFLLFLTALMGGSVVPQFLGMCVGHVYYFLDELYPKTRGGTLFEPPELFLRLIPADTTAGQTTATAGGMFRAGGTAGTPAQGAASRAANPVFGARSRFPGSGHRLGGE